MNYSADTTLMSHSWLYDFTWSGHIHMLELIVATFMLHMR